VKRTIGVSFLVCAVLVLETSCDRLFPAQEDSKRHVVAILPIQNSQDRDMAQQIRTVVTGGLLKNKQKKYYDVVDTSFIDYIIEQHQFENSDWSSPDKVAEVGKALNADIVGIISYRFKTEHFFSSSADVSINFLDINTMRVVAVFTGDASTTNISDNSPFADRIKKIKFNF
jgi:hypothetical protein